MSKQIRRPLSLILTALLLFSTFAALSRQADAATTTPYFEWKQYDSRWGGNVIRSKTVKEVGCLATAIAMLAVQGGLKSEENYDPGAFVKAMKALGGFEANDNLIWSKIPQAVPGLTVTDARISVCGTRAQKIAKIREYADKGFLIAIAVKNESHWVALRSATATAITIMDPGSTATNLFESYDAAGCTRLALLKAAKPCNTGSTSGSQGAGCAATCKSNCTASGCASCGKGGCATTCKTDCPADGCATSRTGLAKTQQNFGNLFGGLLSLLQRMRPGCKR